MTDSLDPGADPLFGLFRQEAISASGVLAGALAILAVDPDHTTNWEPLERAARAVRGAALIVSHIEASDIAGAIGDAIADARRDPSTISPEKISALLSAVDLLKNLPDTSSETLASETFSARIRDVLARLRTSVKPAPPPDLEITAPELFASPEFAPQTPEPVEAFEPEPEFTEPAPASARSSTPIEYAPPIDDPHAGTLLELFREEVRTLCDSLNTGLLELEIDPTDPKRIEPLMRAAHSIKGAARIVSVEPAVEVAHFMEELLVTAQRGKFLIGAIEIDTLLACVDLLAHLGHSDLGAWIQVHGSRASELVATLQAILDGRLSPPGAPPKAAPAPSASTTPTVHPKTDAVPTPQVPSEKSPPRPPAPAVAPSAPPAQPATSPAESYLGDNSERVVRVSAQSLTRLLSLAGESLVEARWLQPFSRSLLKLKKYQDHLADVLDELCRNMGKNSNLTGLQQLAQDARRRLDDCRDVLADRIAVFEIHARQSDDLNSRLYREVIASRMRPFADGTHGLGRMVRDVARQLGKKVRLELLGQDTDVDRDILDKLEAPLGHIIRNAIDHGIEMPDERVNAGKPEGGTIRLEAQHHAGTLNISVSDDGRGIDIERLRTKIVEKKLTTSDMAARMSEGELIDFLFLPGFSTASSVTDVSGRGVGLDVVQATAQAVGGGVRVHSRPGKGTTFELQLPITLSVVRAVLVRISGDPYAFPLNRTDRLLRLPSDRVRTLEGKPHFESDGRHVGLVPAHLVFNLPQGEQTGDELSVVLIADRFHQYGLIVEGFLGEQDLVVRPLDPRFGKVPNLAAAAILEDGSPVLIVDVDDVTRSVSMLVHEGKLRNQKPKKSEKIRRKRVLVVDDSAIVREVERQMLQGRGYEVDIAVDGVDGWNTVRTGAYDLVVSDIDMPRMTGLEFVRAVRADQNLQSLPVVIVSYKDRDEDRVRGMEAGANYYLTKSSFHDGRFLQAIEELIGGSGE